MRKPRNPQYLRNLANTLIQRFHIPRDYIPRDVKSVYEDFAPQIQAVVRPMTAETLGRIVDFGLPVNVRGKTALYFVHCGSYLHKYAGGRELLVEIACTAIVAEMYDIFVEDEDVREGAETLMECLDDNAPRLRD